MPLGMAWSEPTAVAAWVGAVCAAGAVDTEISVGCAIASVAGAAGTAVDGGVGDAPPHADRMDVTTMSRMKSGNDFINCKLLRVNPGPTCNRRGWVSKRNEYTL